MKLYLLSGTATGTSCWDNVIVAAENEEQARNTHPNGDLYEDLPENKWELKFGCNNRWVSQNVKGEWAASPDKVTVEEVGTAKEGTKRGVVLASYIPDYL